MREINRKDEFPLKNSYIEHSTIVSDNVDCIEPFWLIGHGTWMNRKILKYFIECADKELPKLDYITYNIGDKNGHADSYFSHCFNKYLPQRTENYVIDGSTFTFGDHITPEYYRFDETIFSYHSAYLTQEKIVKDLYRDYYNNEDLD